MSLKGFQSGLSKFFTKKWIPIIVLLVICFVLMTYSSSKGSVLDRFSGSGPSVGASNAPSMAAPAAPSVSSQAAPAAAAAAAPALAKPSAAPLVQQPATGYSSQNAAAPSELLPKDQNSQWATLNPVGGNVAMPDLLQAGYHIGLDTIGQTLKNANYQLRSDPIIEKKDIGPWMQSTIEPDYGRIPLEIGQGTR
jgi:hypothetical protein